MLTDCNERFGASRLAALLVLRLALRTAQIDVTINQRVQAHTGRPSLLLFSWPNVSYCCCMLGSPTVVLLLLLTHLATLFSS